MDRVSRRSTEMLRILCSLKQKHFSTFLSVFPTCVVVSLAVILQHRPRLRTATRETATGPQRLHHPLRVPADLDIYSAMGASAKWPPPHPATTHTHHTPVTIALGCYHMSLNNSHYVFFFFLLFMQSSFGLTRQVSDWICECWIFVSSTLSTYQCPADGCLEGFGSCRFSINEHNHCAATLWLGIFTGLRLPQTWSHAEQTWSHK